MLLTDFKWMFSIPDLHLCHFNSSVLGTFIACGSDNNHIRTAFINCEKMKRKQDLSVALQVKEQEVTAPKKRKKQMKALQSPLDVPLHLPLQSFPKDAPLLPLQCFPKWFNSRRSQRETEHFIEEFLQQHREVFAASALANADLPTLRDELMMLLLKDRDPDSLAQKILKFMGEKSCSVTAALFIKKYAARYLLQLIKTHSSHCVQSLGHECSTHHIAIPFMVLQQC
jgi:hypothetical protein